MNRYLILIHHYFGSDEGVMTVVLRAASESAVRDYMAEQFAYGSNWVIQKVQLIGVDAHA